MNYTKVKDKWLYLLQSPETGQTKVLGFTVRTSYLELLADGSLTVFAGYAWDGSSGPSIYTVTFARGSLLHDALYQLLREGLLPKSARKQADETLRAICLEDGMSWLRAQWVYAGVRAFGGFYSRG